MGKHKEAATYNKIAPIGVFRENKEQRGKQHEWNLVTDMVQQRKDSRGEPLEPIESGILDTVVALHFQGFPVINACEGHPDFYRPATPEDAHSLSPVPWVILSPRVDIQDIPEDLLFEENVQLQRRAFQLLDTFYRPRTEISFDARLIIIPEDYECILTNQGARAVKDEPLITRAHKIKQYTEEMRAFTDFLKDEFFGTRTKTNTFPEEFPQ